MASLKLYSTKDAVMQRRQLKWVWLHNMTFNFLGCHFTSRVALCCITCRAKVPCPWHLGYLWGFANWKNDVFRNWSKRKVRDAAVTVQSVQQQQCLVCWRREMRDFQTATRKPYIQKAGEMISIIPSCRNCCDDGWRAVSLCRPSAGFKSELLPHNLDCCKYTYHSVLNCYHPTKDFCVWNQYNFALSKWLTASLLQVLTKSVCFHFNATHFHAGINK